MCVVAIFVKSYFFYLMEIMRIDDIIYTARKKINELALDIPKRKCAYLK